MKSLIVSMVLLTLTSVASAEVQPGDVLETPGGATCVVGDPVGGGIFRVTIYNPFTGETVKRLAGTSYLEKDCRKYTRTEPAATTLSAEVEEPTSTH